MLLALARSAPKHSALPPLLLTSQACGSCWCRAALPQLEELHLAHISLLPPLGAHLLHQLVAGAAPRLGRLDLSGAAFSGDLGMLAGAAALTWLDLSGIGGPASGRPPGWDCRFH